MLFSGSVAPFVPLPSSPTMNRIVLDFLNFHRLIIIISKAFFFVGGGGDPTECGSSQSRDQSQARAVTQATAVTTDTPNPSSTVPQENSNIIIYKDF